MFGDKDKDKDGKAKAQSILNQAYSPLEAAKDTKSGLESTREAHADAERDAGGEFDAGQD